MALAIFDLDNTLIGGDSDYLWGKFLCEEGLVDAADFGARNDRFYADYLAGRLDINAYLRFALSPLRGQDRATLAGWHARFMASKIEPIMLPRARTLVERHRTRGDDLLVITATNRFITEPIALAMGIPDIIACEPEIVDGLYSGEPTGIPSYREGKVERLHQWLGRYQGRCL